MSRRIWKHRGWLLVSALVAVAALGCAPLPPAGVVVVARRPPAARVEAFGVAPGAGYVWITGHWGWQANDYVWLGGRWEAPPRPRARYVQGRWVHGRGGYYWVEGHWA